MNMYKDDANFRRTVERAERGRFREYWLQLYVKNNYRKLGFDSLEGPFETGYDFKGIYNGKKVVVEVETKSSNFIRHGHRKNEVDILIVLNDDADEVLGMKPAEWRKHLPEKIIVVDPEDFVKSTHEMRKEYAIRKQLERGAFLPMNHPFYRIKNAFAKLWHLLVEEAPYEGTPEAEAFDEALLSTTIKYIQTYGLPPEELGSFTRIEVLANDLKSRREFNDLKSEEKEFLEEWLGVLRTEYGSRI